MLFLHHDDLRWAQHILRMSDHALFFFPLTAISQEMLSSISESYGKNILILHTELSVHTTSSCVWGFTTETILEIVLESAH